MWGLLQTIVISIIMIIGSHFLFNYLKNNLTPKKTKHIMDFQLQKYKNMLEDLTNSGGSQEPNNENYLQDMLDNLDSSEFPFYEPSVMGDDTQSEMGSVIDYVNMENELLDMI
jgi:hypothetical protein